MSLKRWFNRQRRRALDHDQLAAGDPWVRLPLVPPLQAFGPGAHDEFSTYLTGPSRITAHSPEAIAEWLLSCRYAEDRLLLDEHDHWQHPATFEVVRSGDCEDYSLWAWRKLLESGRNAEFVVGMQHRADGFVGRHAWVVFQEGTEEFVFDGVQRSVSGMILERQRVQEQYVPQVGAAAERRFAFAGLFRTEWGRRLNLEHAP